MNFSFLAYASSEDINRLIFVIAILLMGFWFGVLLYRDSSKSRSLKYIKQADELHKLAERLLTDRIDQQKEEIEELKKKLAKISPNSSGDPPTFIV
jgi:hypothetical protein